MTAYGILGLPWGYTRDLRRAVRPDFYGAFSNLFYYGGEGGIRPPLSWMPIADQTGPEAREQTIALSRARGS